MEKVLILPHVGTSYGHIYRVLDFIDYIFTCNDDVTMVLPDHALNKYKDHIPQFVKIHLRKVNCSVCNKTGKLDIANYLKLLKENRQAFETIRPTLIVGDPGIQASILAQEFQVNWFGIMHGCYLPFPKVVIKDNTLESLMNLAWMKIHKYLDFLIEIGTNGVYSSWSEIRSTGGTIVPNNYSSYYDVGTNIEFPKNRFGWKIGKPVDFLITCCSAGSVYPSLVFLENLKKYIPQITIAGIENPYNRFIPAEILGDDYLYDSLIDKNTIVLTHCGHGTLNLIKHATNVKMVPGDLDQLCNALIAHAINGWQIVFDKNWFDILNSSTPFERKINWNNINIKSDGSSLIFEGVDLTTGSNRKVDDFCEHAY